MLVEEAEDEPLFAGERARISLEPLPQPAFVPKPIPRRAKRAKRNEEYWAIRRVPLNPVQPTRGGCRPNRGLWEWL